MAGTKAPRVCFFLVQLKGRLSHVVDQQPPSAAPPTENGKTLANLRL